MVRAPRDLVFIIDGTLSSLDEGCETHAGRLFRLLSEGDDQVGYHPGVQGRGWRKWLNAITGEGLNDAIVAAYGAIAARYRPGDRIFLFGYSRGGYAARSLAGFIERVGLLKPQHAGGRRARRAFEYYVAGARGAAADRFRAKFCHRGVEIEMIGVWDTVKALGPPYPILSRLAPAAVGFHDASLGDHIKAGYQALALDENRTAFSPVLWRRRPGWRGKLEQVWFAGAHGDVGGERSCDLTPLPLSQISLVWMLEKAAAHGLALPSGWRARFRLDPAAPMVGASKGVGKLFLIRRTRVVGAGDGERLHTSVIERMRRRPGYRPKALASDRLPPGAITGRIDPVRSA